MDGCGMLRIIDSLGLSPEALLWDYGNTRSRYVVATILAIRPQ